MKTEQTRSSTDRRKLASLNQKHFQCAPQAVKSQTSWSGGEESRTLAGEAAERGAIPGAVGAAHRRVHHRSCRQPSTQVQVLPFLLLSVEVCSMHIRPTVGAVSNKADVELWVGIEALHTLLAMNAVVFLAASCGRIEPLSVGSMQQARWCCSLF